MPTPLPSVDSSLMQTDSLLKFPLFSFTHSSPTLLNTNMQKLIRMIRRLKLGKLTHVGWIRGVKLYVHWSVFEAINALLAFLGFYSLFVAAFNLIPIAPLDGATAWGLIPAWLARRQE